jgi:hypothetical protein
MRKKQGGPKGGERKARHRVASWRPDEECGWLHVFVHDHFFRFFLLYLSYQYPCNMIMISVRSVFDVLMLV